MTRKHRQDEDIEQRLRAERPEPSPALIHAISARAGAAGRPRRAEALRLAFAGGLTLALFVAVASVGGIGYAATSVTHAVVAVKKVVVGKSPSTASKPSRPSKPNRPHRTAAEDQYLPPGTTPQDALDDFQAFIVDANTDLQNTLNCNTGSRAQRVACEARKRALQAQQRRLAAEVRAAIAEVPDLSTERQAAVARMLAIHIQQQQALADVQATRRGNCARPAYARTHRALCARANPATEATERLRLGQLQLDELQAFLAG